LSVSTIEGRDCFQLEQLVGGQANSKIAVGAYHAPDLFPPPFLYLDRSETSEHQKP